MSMYAPSSTTPCLCTPTYPVPLRPIHQQRSAAVAAAAASGHPGDVSTMIDEKAHHTPRGIAHKGNVTAPQAISTPAAAASSAAVGIEQHKCALLAGEPPHMNEAQCDEQSSPEAVAVADRPAILLPELGGLPALLADAGDVIDSGAQ